jgi:hypothetical protein
MNDSDKNTFRTIWKYSFSREDMARALSYETAGLMTHQLIDHVVTVDMPKGAEILSVHQQRNSLCFWALVFPNQEREKRRFVICGTGYPVFDEKLKFLGTAFFADGNIVFHVFEKLE